MSLAELALDEPLFLDLLTKLVGEGKRLQNSPPDWIPEEAAAARHVIEVLKPFSTDCGGPLVVTPIEFAPGRTNIIISLPGGSSGCASFVGSHLDVVPAATDGSWAFPPFELTISGDRLQGRGTTDCLGHVALITCLLLQLARESVPLGITVNAVLIASEEDESIPGLGLDGLLAAGHLSALKDGPLFWIDSADSQPCIATGGFAIWHINCSSNKLDIQISDLLFEVSVALEVTPAEVAFELVEELQRSFYALCPPHPKEAEYLFQMPSTMKPTRCTSAANSVCISGDVRLTPFYDVFTVQALLKETAANTLHSRRIVPSSKYSKSLRVSLSFDDDAANGIVCDLQSPALLALAEATTEVRGKCEMYSDTGSLPLVDTLTAQGYDVQIDGFGLTECYHAEDEYALLSDMQDGFCILAKTLAKYDAIKNPPTLTPA